MGLFVIWMGTAPFKQKNLSMNCIKTFCTQLNENVLDLMMIKSNGGPINWFEPINNEVMVGEKNNDCKI